MICELLWDHNPLIEAPQKATNNSDLFKTTMSSIPQLQWNLLIETVFVQG